MIGYDVSGVIVDGRWRLKVRWTHSVVHLELRGRCTRGSFESLVGGTDGRFVKTRRVLFGVVGD